MSSTILPIFFALYVTAWGCGVINGIFLKKLFRSRYPKVAERIFPALTESSISSGLARWRYIAGGEYRGIDDPGFVSRVDRHRTIEIICVSVLALGMIIGAVIVAVRR